MLSLTSAQLDTWLAALLWPLSRVLGLMSSAPILGHARVPARVRVALAVLLSLALTPVLPPLPELSPFSAQGLLIIAVQFLIGLSMGYTVRLVFHAIEMAGDLIGVQMGLGFALLYDPQSHAQVPILSQFLALLATLVFLGIDGHLHMINALADSFRALPITAEAPRIDWAQLAVTWGTMVLRTALSLALPVVTALIIANLALGILTRAAPQLNMFAVGFPITLAVGMLALLVSLPVVLPQATHLLQQATHDMTALLAPRR